MGNNVGIRYALDMNADYIFCLNNDTVVAKDTLTKLVNTLLHYPKIGLISPLIYFYDNPGEIQFCGSYVDWENKSIIKLNNLDEITDDMSISLWGTALLIRREVIEHVGYLNEKYFAYHEDEEYSMRVLKAGFQNSVHPDAKIYHKNSRSTGSNDAPMQVFLRSRNLYFLWMDALKGMERIFQIRRYLAYVISYGGSLRQKNLPDAVEACLDGVWHAFRGAGGPRNPEITMPIPLRKMFHFLFSWHPYFWADLLRGDFTEIASNMRKRTRVMKAKN
jgi:GT2 family glycosyltransferase